MAAFGYQGTANPRDKGKAIVAVALVHAALAAMILIGLNGEIVRQAVDDLVTIDVAEPNPPPPPRPRAPREQKAAKAAGAPARKAEATPVVAPAPRIPLPSPIPAAPVAGAGSAASQGAGVSGSGTGASGAGNGRGSGGDFSKFTPARLVRNLTRGDYRQLAGGRLPAGRAMVALRVEPSGVPSNCRVVRSSGDGVVDGGLCQVIVDRLRFRPALDDQGRPIPYQLQYVATWQL